MKKISTLVIFALGAMSVNAQQEVWTAAEADLTAATTQTLTTGIYGAGTAEGPDTSVPGELTTSIIVGQTASITVTGLSTPNGDEMAEILEGKKVAWEVKGGGNQSFVKKDPDAENSDRDTVFAKYVIGKGNCEFVHWEYDEETENGTSHRAYGTAWTPESTTIPAKGAYWKFDAAQSGDLSICVFTNKQKREFWIYDGTINALVPNTSIKVASYFNNNGWAYASEKDDNGEVIEGSQKYLLEGTMPESYIIQQTGDNNFGQQAIAMLTFPVESGHTYYAINYNTQPGLYGFLFSGNGVNGIKNIESTSETPAYNLAGQRVAAGTKGLLIKNGKKYIVK